MMKPYRLSSPILFLLSLLWLAPAAAQLPAEALRFADELSKQEGIERGSIIDLLQQANFRQEILDKMEGRAEKKAWHQYRPIFLTQERIDKGVDYWKRNERLLGQAEREFGVPPEIIVAILGVETKYGERAGDTRVLDALYTLAFGYPKRAKFFQGELAQFILLSREAHFDPTQVTGSYAGAMGATQFISSSYRRFALDYDKDGRTDLWQSSADIIGSVANYFARNHWQAGGPVAGLASGVQLPRHRPLLLADKERILKEVLLPQDKPSHALASLAQAGIRPAQPVPGDPLAYLMAFETGPEQYEFWLGFNNFYAISRYNRSPLYAMAVHQLSQELHARQRPSQGKPLAFH